MLIATLLPYSNDQIVSTVQNVYRNHEAYWGRGEMGGGVGVGGMDAGEKGDYIPVSTLPPDACA